MAHYCTIGLLFVLLRAVSFFHTFLFAADYLFHRKAPVFFFSLSTNNRGKSVPASTLVLVLLFNQSTTTG